MPNDFFEDDDHYTGPPLTAELVAGAESTLGVRLPSAYLALMRERNGGVPRRRCFPTPFVTSWAPDHFKISAILGLGGSRGIDSSTGVGSRDLIREWDYPNIGVVVCDTPSGGHDTVMLDYRRAARSGGEPSVVYIDEDRSPREIAASFDDFVQALVEGLDTE